MFAALGSTIRTVRPAITVNVSLVPLAGRRYERVQTWLLAPQSKNQFCTSQDVLSLASTKNKKQKSSQAILKEDSNVRAGSRKRSQRTRDVTFDKNQDPREPSKIIKRARVSAKTGSYAFYSFSWAARLISGECPSSSRIGAYILTQKSKSSEHSTTTNN